MLNKSLKYSLLTFDELVINLDRLSRFKIPDESFHRVFCSIISKHLISPKFSKKDFEEKDVKVLVKIVKKIWNDSVRKCCEDCEISYAANDALKYLIKNTFKNIDEKTMAMINVNLNIAPILKKIDYNSAPLNLKFLIKVNEKELNYNEIREKYSLCFPVKKLLIVEGITEEILLPVFSEKLKKSFNKNGVYIMGAGGKSKSLSLYMQLRESLKIPVILLFDEDAKEICESLDKNLLKKDKYILIRHGEFEDILPINLIKRGLNNEYKLIEPVRKEELCLYDKMCNNIEMFYKSRHLGEFKKSKLAKIIAENIKYETDVTEDIKNIIFTIL